MSTVRHDQLVTVAQATIDKALQKVQIPTLVPATVISYDVASSIAQVTIDGDNSAVTQCANVTGHFLGADQRVLVGFFPPRGVFVTGIITPQPYPNVKWARVLIDATVENATTTYIAWPPAPSTTGPLEFTFNKLADDTGLLITLHIGRFFTVTGVVVVQFGVDVNDGAGTYPIIRAVPNILTEQQDSGTLLLEDLPAGPRLITLMAHVVPNATGAVRQDDDSYDTMTVEEVPVL